MGTPGETILLKAYLKGFIGLLVKDLDNLIQDGRRLDFYVQCEDEIFHVRTTCGYGLLYAQGGQRGTENKDHPLGSIVRRVA